MPGFYTGGGGATAADVWGYPTRTLTQYLKTAEIIKNKDYVRASPEDIIFSIVAYAVGMVTADELASFIDFGVVNRGLKDVYANIIQANPFNVWVSDWIADVMNSPSLSPSSIKSILASPYISADRVQAILYRMADKGYFDKLLQVMTFDASDASFTTSTTLTTGVNRYRMLSIASGVTLTLGASPGVIIADTVTNNGTIASGWWRGAGGVGGGNNPGVGGRGAGGIIILARSIAIGTIIANGEKGGNGSPTTYSGNGGSGGGGLFWVVSPDTPPSGGNGGGPQGGAGNPNGGGGGGAYIYRGGAGGSSTVTSFASAQSYLAELFKTIVDWWLVNVMGKTPSSTKSIPSLGGGGGGGGGAIYDITYGIADAGGGGGGGGGQTVVYGTGVIAGTLIARGGGGGNGYSSYGGGGGGGGGGIIYVFYKSLTGTNTFNVAGGAGGTTPYYPGAPGGAGIGRAIAV
jgi:hypothetical protein